MKNKYLKAGALILILAITIKTSRAQSASDGQNERAYYVQTLAKIADRYYLPSARTS